MRTHASQKSASHLRTRVTEGAEHRAESKSPKTILPPQRPARPTPARGRLRVGRIVAAGMAVVRGSGKAAGQRVALRVPRIGLQSGHGRVFATHASQPR